jgi:DNA-binding GntR family transcriptional regulator
MPAAKPRTPRVDAEPQFSRAQWLAEILRERIIAGAYQPGERIREAQLREEFGFSNGPIREALQKVVAAGLAESAPWQGVRVRLLDEAQILELFQVRLALLEYAAELAARNASAETQKSAVAIKRSMDKVFSGLDADADHPSFNGSLSQWLLASAGNGTLREIWDKTMQQTLVYVNASLRTSHGAKTRVHIRALIDRICAGDVDGARAAARALTRQTVRDLGIEGEI